MKQNNSADLSEVEAHKATSDDPVSKKPGRILRLMGKISLLSH